MHQPLTHSLELKHQMTIFRLHCQSWKVEPVVDEVVKYFSSARLGELGRQAFTLKVDWVKACEFQIGITVRSRRTYA